MVPPGSRGDAQVVVLCESEAMCECRQTDAPSFRSRAVQIVARGVITSEASNLLFALLQRCLHVGKAGPSVATLPRDDTRLWLRYTDEGRGAPSSTPAKKARTSSSNGSVAPSGSQTTRSSMSAGRSSRGCQI